MDWKLENATKCYLGHPKVYLKKSALSRHFILNDWLKNITVTQSGLWEPIVVFFLVSSQTFYQPGKLANQVTTLALSSDGIFKHYPDFRLLCCHQLCMVIFVS